jgi:hypothetical protein
MIVASLKPGSYATAAAAKKLSGKPSVARIHPK